MILSWLFRPFFSEENVKCRQHLLIRKEWHPCGKAKLIFYDMNLSSSIELTLQIREHYDPYIIKQ